MGNTGKQQDSYIKLIYLRSRIYSPVTGRFTTKDSWQGDYNRPLSLNRWNYTEGNPVNFVGTSGHDPWWCDGRSDEKECLDSWAHRNDPPLPSTPIPPYTPAPFNPHNQESNSADGNLGAKNSFNFKFIDKRLQ